MIPWWIVSLDILEHPCTLWARCWSMLNFLFLAWTSVRMNILKTILDTFMLFLSRLYSASLSWFSHSLKVVATGPKLTQVIHLTARALVAACFPIVQQRSRDVVEPRQNVKLKCTISVIHQPWRKVHSVIWHVNTAMVWNSWPTAKSMLEFNLSSHHLMTISWPSHGSPHTQKLWRPRLAGALDVDQMIKWSSDVKKVPAPITSTLVSRCLVSDEINVIIWH